MKYLKYLWYVLKHKWFVFLECCKLGIWWRGVTHDFSKFLPSEFIPYARYFKGTIKRGRNATGYYKPYETGDGNFDRAWFYHQKRNNHHWQYWIIPLDGEGCHALKIPEMVIREMVADWRGAGKAQGTPDTVKWYKTNKDKLQLHPQARNRIEELLGINHAGAARRIGE
ncbi:MAG: DUF5662 family protein [Thiothrix sp.]|jgi:hypothetical protein|uniref:DUF5662 family protein n=1 Tax=Thiothrix sp. TaxID=1032 RepID=UPI00261653BF|nr:DUF5662 family protein [Thiothrix sp.]MDD5395195.1 DUF5662 family protein [Thiothrix sp.]